MTVPLNFKVIGSGNPVIILHGFLGSLDNWQTFAKQLAKKYMVITVDLRNHGKSPHQDLFSYDIMAEDLKDFMESEWIYSAHIIGHSMGGKTAMYFANNYPELVDKLIVVDISPKSYPGGHYTILKALNAIPIGRLESRQEAEDILADYIDDSSVRGFLMKNLKRNGNGYEWKINLPTLTSKYEEILEAIDIQEFEKPTLFVRGEKSDYILDTDFSSIQEGFPNSSFVTIPNAGHWVHADKPKVLLAAVENFIV